MREFFDLLSKPIAEAPYIIPNVGGLRTDKVSAITTANSVANQNTRYNANLAQQALSTTQASVKAQIDAYNGSLADIKAQQSPYTSAGLNALTAQSVLMGLPTPQGGYLNYSNYIQQTTQFNQAAQMVQSALQNRQKQITEAQNSLTKPPRSLDEISKEMNTLLTKQLGAELGYDSNYVWQMPQITSRNGIYQLSAVGTTGGYEYGTPNRRLDFVVDPTRGLMTETVTGGRGEIPPHVDEGLLQQLETAVKLNELRQEYVFRQSNKTDPFVVNPTTMPTIGEIIYGKGDNRASALNKQLRNSTAAKLGLITSAGHTTLNYDSKTGLGLFTASPNIQNSTDFLASIPDQFKDYVGQIEKNTFAPQITNLKANSENALANSVNKSTQDAIKNTIPLITGALKLIDTTPSKIQDRYGNYVGPKGIQADSTPKTYLGDFGAIQDFPINSVPTKQYDLSILTDAEYQALSKYAKVSDQQAGRIEGFLGPYYTNPTLYTLQFNPGDKQFVSQVGQMNTVLGQIITDAYAALPSNLRAVYAPVANLVNKLVSLGNNVEKTAIDVYGEAAPDLKDIIANAPFVKHATQDLYSQIDQIDNQLMDFYKQTDPTKFLQSAQNLAAYKPEDFENFNWSGLQQQLFGNAPEFTADTNLQKTALDSLRSTPGYQFAFDQGQQAIQTSAAAKHNLLSGATQQSLAKFGQDLADTQYNQTLQNLAGVVASGQNAQNQITNATQANAAGIAGSYGAASGQIATILNNLATQNNAATQGLLGTLDKAASAPTIKR